VNAISSPAGVLLVADFSAGFPFLTDAGVTETKPAFTALSMRLALGVFTAGLIFPELLCKRFTDFSAKPGVFRTL
jgi:hypothetical protein